MLPWVDGLPTVVGGVRAALAVPWSCADAARFGNRLKGAAMNFNDRLADLRRRKGLSQEQLGYELGVSRQTVSKWELGQSYPDFQKLVLLSDYYEMSLDELVRGVDVGDVRALNESEKQISSIYSDVERGKDLKLPEDMVQKYLTRNGRMTFLWHEIFLFQKQPWIIVCGLMQMTLSEKRKQRS